MAVGMLDLPAVDHKDPEEVADQHPDEDALECRGQQTRDREKERKRGKQQAPTYTGTRWVTPGKKGAI